MLVEAKPRIISGKQKRNNFKGIETLQRPDMCGLALVNTFIWDVI